MLWEFPNFHLLLFMFGIGFRTKGKMNLYVCLKKHFSLFLHNEMKMTILSP